jgi:hypothetical protein
MIRIVDRNVSKIGKGELSTNASFEVATTALAGAWCRIQIAIEADVAQRILQSAAIIP